MDALTLLNFIEKVKKMREKQKEYFRTRSSIALKEAKALERDVDQIITENQKPPTEQQQSFF